MFWKKKGPAFEWPDNTQLDAAMKEGHRLQQPHFTPFFVALIHAQLVLPLHHAPATGADESRERELALLTMPPRDGEVVAVAFTNEAAFRLCYGQRTIQVAGMSAPDVCDMVLRNGWKSLLLNPRGPVGYGLGLPELQAVAHRQVYESEHRLRVQEKTPVQLGRLRDRPDDETMQAIKGILERAGVIEAWWCGISYNEGEPNYCLGIAVHDMEKAMSYIGPQINKLWEKREQKRFVDIMNLDDGLGEGIREVGECIWRRELMR